MLKYIIMLVVMLGIGLMIGWLISQGTFSSLSGKLPLSCSYKGQTYSNNERFSDDCNFCSCSAGKVECTENECKPVAL